MSFGRLLLVMGLACFAASVIAQPSLTDQILNGDLSAGTYLVDGTGVVYDKDFVSIYVNGTVVGTIPIPAEAPKAEDIHTKGTSQAPGLSDDVLGNILGQLSGSDPLDKVIIGRKMK